MTIKERKILKSGAVVIVTKKRRLKTRYKILIVLCYLLIGFLGVKSYLNNINDMLTSCDQQKGYTCSYYEAELLAKRGDLYD